MNIKPGMIIYRESKPYIYRWFLIPRNRWLNIYLHKGVLSDYITPHDHPWWNLSILLRGTYREYQYTIKDGQPKCVLVEKRKRFRPIFRKATQLHRLELTQGPFWSLFITGPAKRVWGFQAKKGWISHEVVLDIDRVKGTSKIKPEYEKDWV